MFRILDGRPGRKRTVICIGFIMAFIAGGLWAEAMPKKLKFLGESLILANEQSNDKQYLAEYIPPQNTFDNYKDMFAMYFFKGQETNATEAAALKLNEIKKRKENGDPLADGTVYVKGTTQKEAVLDFSVSESGIIENNIMFFKNTPKGLLLVKFVQRFYEKNNSPDDVKIFVKKLKKKRQAVVDELGKRNWPLPDMAQ